MKAAIVGYGPHGKRVASALDKRGDVTLVAVVDRRPEVMADASLGPAVVRLGALDALWAERPDLVCVATNGPSHEAIAIAAIEAGAGRVMIEKPMACSVAECRRIVAAAARTGARVSVNQSRRVDPFYRWLAGEVQRGRWGRLRSVHIMRPGIGLGCLGTHSFDVVRQLSGRDARAVTAWIDPFIGPNPRGADLADAGGTVVIDLGDDTRAIVQQIEDAAGPLTMELHLTAGRIRVCEKYDRVEIVERDLSVKPGPDRPAAYAEVTPPQGISARTNVATMLSACLDDLIGEAPLLCAPEHGVRAIEVLAAAYASHDRGHVPVALPLSEPAVIDRWLPIT